MSVDVLLDYIDQNLKEDISLVDLSMLVHYSTRQVYYILKEATGLPVMSYIRQQRLLRARNEVSNGRKLFDVALDYGFETQAGFYKAFQTEFGCSPKEYQFHEYLNHTCSNYPSITKLSMEGNIMDEIKIRKVQQSDVKSIWENIFSRNTPEEVNVRIAESIAEMEAGRRIHLVAVVDDTVIGNIELLKEQHPLYAHRCGIYDMVVNPAFQHQGLATRLFQEACKYMKSCGVTCVTTTCRNDGVEKFYEAIGMKECGRIPGGIVECWGEHRKFDEVMFWMEV